MRTLLLTAVVAIAAGCDDKKKDAKPAPNAPDPTVRVSDGWGGGLGPVGAERVRTYEGRPRRLPTGPRPRQLPASNPADP